MCKGLCCHSYSFLGLSKNRGCRVSSANEKILRNGARSHSSYTKLLKVGKMPNRIIVNFCLK